MAHKFDRSYADEPFLSLCESYPGADVYPGSDFRIEWGPLFHRGRLDGSARVLLIGQDPAQHETITRRILVGEAGQRTQGFLAKLGITRSYVMLNTYLYSVYGQGAANQYANDPDVAAYRHQWLNAIITHNNIDAIIALGSLANNADHLWLPRAPSGASAIAYRYITHPTAPNSGAAAGGDYNTLVQAMLA